MKIKYRIFSVISLLIIITAVAFSIIFYNVEKRMRLKAIDETLYFAAHGVNYILPDDYHNNIDDKNSVPVEEYLTIVDTFNKICEKNGLQYLWSLMKIDGTIVFTSGTSTSKDVSKGDHAMFFDVHSNPDAYKTAFETMEVQYTTIKDKWGTIRAVLIPMTDNRNRPYLVAASMEISDVIQLSREEIVKPLTIILLLVVISMIVSFLLARTLSFPLMKLTETAGRISKGDLDCALDISGSDEIASLSSSVDNMRISIRNQMNELEEKNKVLKQDIEDRKAAQAEKEKLQDQLLQSQKMEAIGVLAGGVAHDFNNLLGIIMGSAQLAQCDVEKGSQVAEELSVIIDSSKRAKDLTMKLLTFARKDRTEKSANSAGKIIDDVTAILERSLPKSIVINSIVKRDAKIFCDANQVHQALMNICTNAADAMPGGGELTIECDEIDFAETICETCGKKLTGRYCRIQVSDTGTGIPKDLIPKVTDPFFTTKDVGKGTGLGMSVTHGIVDSHGGHLHIYSEEKKGTTVKMCFPVSNADHTEPAPGGPEKETAGTETILVIDDEEALLNIAGRILSKNGYEALLAPGALEGIELFRANRDRIALVVLDLMMPEMDGADVFARLKEIEPAVRVVFASGYSLNGQVHHLLEKENHRFVQKPFEIEELCATIREVLDSPE